MKEKIKRWLIAGTVISWLIAFAIAAWLTYCGDLFAWDDNRFTAMLFFAFFPPLCWLIASIVTAGNDYEQWDRHIERIKCPACLKNCEAEVIRSEPWYVYIHECEHCGYFITESEWESV